MAAAGDDDDLFADLYDGEGEEPQAPSVPETTTAEPAVQVEPTQPVVPAAAPAPPIDNVAQQSYSEAESHPFNPATVTVLSTAPLTVHSRS